jgi:hypothetical protein
VAGYGWNEQKASCPIHSLFSNEWVGYHDPQPALFIREPSGATEVRSQLALDAKYAIESHILHMSIPRDVEGRLKRSAKTAPVIVRTGGVGIQSSTMPLRLKDPAQRVKTQTRTKTGARSKIAIRDQFSDGI